MTRSSRSDTIKAKKAKGQYRARPSRHVSTVEPSPALDSTVSVTHRYVSREELLESIRSKAQTLPDGPI